MDFSRVLVILMVTCGSWAIEKTWWKHATIYEVYLRSFKDSDGDGIGDLRGLISKLDYFVDIGVDTIYLAPFYPSPMADGGYDITNFTAIDPAYGSMEDFEELTRQMKNRGLYFLMDLVINHSSDEHEWFQKSVDKIEPYDDYYVWADAKDHDWDNNPIPPNNWRSMFPPSIKDSAWTWNQKRNQFYLRQFGEKQPDLNLRNELVKDEIKAIIKFWLDKGVTGFRVDAPAFFLEDPLLRDELISDPLAPIEPGTEEQRTRRFSHPDTYRFLNEINLFLRQYDLENNKRYESVMIGESYAHVDIVMKYYGTKNFPVTHFPFNFILTVLFEYLDAHRLLDYLNTWLKKLPRGAASNWALGNHDQGRIFNRFNKEYNSVLLALVTMLPGASCIYYGEELAQEEMDITVNVFKNPFIDRDCHRLPMQWSDTLNAGFSSGDKPWLPVHPSYWRLNVEAQEKHQNSSLNYFKDLTSIRKTKTFKSGVLRFYTISKWVLAFTRTSKQSKYIIILNLGTESHIVDLNININDLPSVLTVVATSANSGYTKGQILNVVSKHPDSLILRPHSSLVLFSN